MDRKLKRMEERRAAERAKIRAARKAWRTHKQEQGSQQGPQVSRLRRSEPTGPLPCQALIACDYGGAAGKQVQRPVEQVLRQLPSESDVLDFSRSPDPLASPARRIQFSDEVVVQRPPTSLLQLDTDEHAAAPAQGGARQTGRRPEPPAPSTTGSDIAGELPHLIPLLLAPQQV